MTKLLKGFTLPELLVVMGIMATLFSMMTINYFGVQGRSYLKQGGGIMIADLYTQKSKAMSGATFGGATTAGYGVHFETTSYTLFPGDTYSLGDPNNVVVDLPGNIEIATVTWVDNKIVFNRSSGEVQGYTADQDYIDLVSTTSGDTTRIRLNRLGVVVEGL